MSQLIKSDSEYKTWVESLSRRFRQSQIKAAVKVNRELLAFYWSLGKDIVEMKAESRWGSGFMETLSKDLRAKLPSAKGLSVANLRYIKRFYVLYAPLIQMQNTPESPLGVVDNFPASSKAPQVVEEFMFVSDTKSPQAVEFFEKHYILGIPWGHHRLIIDKCGKEENRDKALFYVRQTLENNWSRATTIEEIENELKG